MSTRLTKTLQSQILRNMKTRFEGDHTEEYKIANLIYEEFHNKYKNVLDQLPEGAYVHTRDIHAWGFNREYKNSYLYFQLKESRKCLIYSRTPKIEPNSHLADELKKYWQWYNQQSHTWEIIEKSMYELFSSVNTVKQLLQSWPEGIQFLPQDALQPKKVVNPLAVNHNVDTINALLGIE